MQRLLALPALALLTLAMRSSLEPAPTAAFAAGPPAVCFPIDLGDDQAIPERFGEGFGPDQLVSRMHAALEGSDRTLVHMETLRCATWSILNMTKGQGVTKEGLGHAVTSHLRWRLVRALADERARREAGLPAPEGQERELGLAWFDLAYFQGAMGQALRFETAGCEDAMSQAMQLLPKDASAQFGCALALWESDQYGELGFYPRLRRALDLEAAGHGDAQLLENMLNTCGHLIGTEDRAAMDAKVNARLAGE
ncbi:MAG: hypothetical protein P1V81_06410 [Planctomycetota bacterium]|nr:hypothetical protein [Planctomycetota bacterium]